MRSLATILLLVAPIAASAQLLPRTPLPQLPVVGGAIDAVRNVPGAAIALVNDRLLRIDTLVRTHPDAIERDDRGNPARAGEIIVVDPDDALVTAASRAGFALVERDAIDGIGYARFAAPQGRSLAGSIRAMRRIARGHDVSADQLHFQSGSLTSAAPTAAGGARGSEAPGRIGIVDGGVAGIVADAGVTRAGFAHGAPGSSDHGSAIASLLRGTATVRGAASAARLWAADVYGSDPAGGSAIAIARAIGWLGRAEIPVVVISLVGPANPLLARVVKAAQDRGMIIVAAVGNDGPAAPPSYPASYPGVVAVTGVDGRDRALIEAGRALHLDYAAPGADMLAADAQGRAVSVRGTSFAAPLVAARIAAVYPVSAPSATGQALSMIDREPRDLGNRGPDPRYGRGLLCDDCRTPPK